MAKKVSIAPLMENEHVKELLSIMKSNNLNAKDLQEMFGYVSKMEKQLDTALGELAAMRQEINQMRNNPMKTALQNSVRALENAISEAIQRLDTLKQNIIDGCKNAVSAFKENGIKALSNVMSFFKVKEQLMDIRKGMNAAVQSAEKSITKIESVSSEYHQMTRHIKNIGRVMVSKEPITEAKPIGGIAKAAQAPHQFRKTVVSAAVKGVDRAIAKVESLQQRAEKKPSVLDNLKNLKEQVAQAARASPTQDKTKSQQASI